MNTKHRTNQKPSRLGRSALVLAVASAVALAGLPAAATAAPAGMATTITAPQSVLPAAAKRVTNGTLRVIVSGVPKGKKPLLRVKGPNGYSKKLTRSSTLTGLKPGTYKITGASVKSGKSVYYPVAGKPGYVIKAGKSLTASVKYGRTTLRVSIAGVPRGKKPTLRVKGPKGFSRAISKSTSFAGVASGRYTVTGSALKAGKSTYYPNPAAVSAVRGKTTVAPVRFQRSTAKITVTGVPKNTTVRLKVTGPRKYAKSVNVKGSISLADLPAGTYSVTGKTFTVGKGATKGIYRTPGTAKFRQYRGKPAKAAFRYTSGVLKIKLTHLPATKATTKVSLTGPAGYKKVLRINKTTTLMGLKAGTYSITAGQVKVTTGTKRGTFVPEGPKSSKVSVGKTAVATYSFATVIAPTTSVVPKGEVVKGDAVYANPSGKGTVSLKGSHRVGDIVISPKSAKAPQGLWIRLDKLVSTSGGTRTFTTSIPKIDEVLARGDFSTDVRIPVVLDSSSNPATARSRTASGMGDVYNTFKKNLKCGASATMEVETKVSGAVTASVEAKWGWLSESYLKADAVARIDGSTMASVSGAAHCTLARTNILPKPINLPVVMIPTPVPGVAIPMINTLQFTAQGKASAEASMATSASVTVKSSIGGKLTKNGLSTYYQPPALTHTYNPPTLTASGSAELFIGVRADMKLAGLAGPFVTAAIGPKVSADIKANPWWKIDGQFKAGIGIDPGAFKHLGLREAEKDNVINRSWLIAKAPGPLGGPAPGNGGGPGPVVDDGSPGAPALRKIANYGSFADLGCSLNTEEDTSGEFYANTACGTLLSIDGTLYGPTYIPASGLSPSAFTPVGQTVSGTGTAASPKVVTTTVRAGATGVELVQTDSWVSKGSVIKSSVAVKNTTAAAKTLRVYRAFDCYLGDSDTGTGELHVPGQLAGCLRTTGSGEVVTLRLQAMSSGATVTQSSYRNVWNQVGAQGDMNNACDCSADIDNGVGIAWKKTIPARQTLNLNSEISLTRPRR